MPHYVEKWEQDEKSQTKSTSQVLQVCNKHQYFVYLTKIIDDLG